jgi:hypothetical protein
MQALAHLQLKRIEAVLAEPQEGVAGCWPIESTGCRACDVLKACAPEQPLLLIPPSSLEACLPPAAAHGQS